MFNPKRGSSDLERKRDLFKFCRKGHSEYGILKIKPT